MYSSMRYFAPHRLKYQAEAKMLFPACFIFQLCKILAKMNPFILLGWIGSFKIPDHVGIHRCIYYWWTHETLIWTHPKQALARLRFSETVAQSDVDEALRLMQMSKFSLYSDDRQKSGLDAISDIYSILRDEAARTNKMDVSYAHALNWISRKVSCNSYHCSCLHLAILEFCRPS